MKKLMQNKIFFLEKNQF